MKNITLETDRLNLTDKMDHASCLLLRANLKDIRLMKESELYNTNASKFMALIEAESAIVNLIKVLEP